MSLHLCEPKGPWPLISGLGRAVSGTASPLAVINVVLGKRYRLRIIGLSYDPSYNFTIYNHQMTIIEADGESTEQHIVDSMEIGPAGVALSLWKQIGRSITIGFVRTHTRPEGVLVSTAVGTQQSFATEAPQSQSQRPLNLHARYNVKPPGKPYPGGADIVIPIRHAIFHGPGPHFENMNGTYAAEDLFPKGAIYKLPPNKVIELIICGSGTVDGGPISSNNTFR
ncbi:hypothetical protein DXG01_006335 [Tephrocybe rancida]|nr:hypothetical protein DXG01_006335 [Tephrocybe rancida]